MNRSPKELNKGLLGTFWSRGWDTSNSIFKNFSLIILWTI